MQNQQPYADDESDRDLKSELHPSGKSQVAHLADLCVVVPKADGAEPHQAEQRHPDLRIPQIRQQQYRDDDGNDDQHSAHGGRSRLLEVRFRTVLANVLADLEFAQLPDQTRTDDNRKHQGGYAVERRWNGGVMEDTERPEVRITISNSSQYNMRHSEPIQRDLNAGAARALEEDDIAFMRYLAEEGTCLGGVVEKVRGVGR